MCAARRQGRVRARGFGKRLPCFSFGKRLRRGAFLLVCVCRMDLPNSMVRSSDTHREKQLRIPLHAFVVFQLRSSVSHGLLNTGFKHRVAEFVCIVPALVLLYKLVASPKMGSMLAQTSSWPALHEYFRKAFLIAESHNWTQFAQLFSNPDMVRGATQRTFTAPFYGGNAYSLAAMIGRRNLSLQVALRRLRHEHWQSNAESLAGRSP